MVEEIEKLIVDVAEELEAIMDEGGHHDYSAGYAALLAGVVGLVAYHGFMNRKTKGIKNNFLLTKDQLCQAVAAGMEDAVKQYTGEDVDYFCQINPVPEPKDGQKH